MRLKCKYRNYEDLNVDFYPNLLSQELAQGWYNYLEYLFASESNSKHRETLLVGDEGTIYTVSYRPKEGTTRNNPVQSWDSIPYLLDLKCIIEKVTEQKYTVCAIQRYPNGNIGIAPHRDKEMVTGTSIAGLSLGAVRTISFSKGYYNYQSLDPINIPLYSGSLYVMNPPTNQKWVHSIIKDPNVNESRISLTFRDYKN